MSQASQHLQTLQQAIAPWRNQLVQHPVYQSLDQLEAIRCFMSAHVFAVWDFMSQVKSLQRQLTSIDLPWQPVGSASTRFLINEIVVGEESDIDPEGGYISHFELYLRAMDQAGADATAIKQVLTALQHGRHWQQALQQDGLPQHAAQFSQTSLDFAFNAPVGVLAAVFTFGREDLIPAMFIAMLDELDEATRSQLSVFKYYLERHIEVDGDHHSHLALAMTQELLGDDAAAWQLATEAVITSLKSRIALWDGVAAAVAELGQEVA